jgi:hypothetical protein
MTEKKPSKPGPKNQKKSKSKKQTKKPLKLVKSNNQTQHGLLPHVSYDDIEPPDGFRSVSMTQALMEYASPITKIVPLPNNDIGRTNEIFSVGMEIWNYTIDESISKKTKKSEKEMLSLISERLGLDKNDAREFLSMMVERKHFLFPDEVQPKGTPFMFLRKQVSYLISKFDNEESNLSKEVLGPNAIDMELVRNLNWMDQHIRVLKDYDKCEKIFEKVQGMIFNRFKTWLIRKGVSQYREQLVLMVGMYLDFIYGYEHEQPLTLKDGPGKYLAEFTVDFLLRKVTLKPSEYTLCPSALRLFYTFLYEKEYLRDPPEVMIEFLVILEPHFVDILREEFN